MSRRFGIASLTILLFLTGCFPFLQPEKEELELEELEEEQTVEIVPQITTPENYYQSVLYDGTYLHGESRGFGNAVVYNRLDLDQLEMGLTSVAQQYFEPDHYFFREGQFIKRDELNSWLKRYDADKNPTGLNPELGQGESMKEREESQPRYLSHILEHNYLVQNKNGNLELGGIVIGLSMNSVYNFRVEDDQGLYYFYETVIEEEAMKREGQKIANEIVSRLRSDNRDEGVLKNVPIVVAMFREQPRESVIPGHFFLKAIAEPNNSLDRWQEINEQYYLFPSRDASTDVRNDADQFQRFKDEIQDFFDSYIGVVGKGHYVNNQLRELTIEIPIRYQGKAEIVALTQYTADRITQRFHENLKVTVYVTSVSGKRESMIVRNSKDEPFIHIFE
ncbi:CamS family sex pheromone protein [Halalkalibacter urbisdiaboli]|uniref:CamS family sex pheromone protein n=1 Tax=Halalkalibacter urbisdiaboli TaxID=1960589 RepID=UPI000B4373FA|nr:CamS family sex pheromone protein [Halalkalibacter urbisdiaboli]